jgi:hypothetical protein
MEKKTYDLSGNTIITGFTPTSLTTGDIIEGDVIEYDKFNFLQTVTNEQEYYIYTPCDSGATSIEIKWKYRPFIPIQIRVFNNEVERVNLTGSSTEDIQTVPIYATPIDNFGNVVWRNLLDKGFFDPLTEDGTAFPFVNQRHYVFDNYLLNIVPDLDDSTTEEVFTQIKFQQNEILNILPITKPFNFGDPC